MLSLEQVDRLICLLSSWERETLLSQFLAYRSDFPVDLTPDYLGRQTAERVRHLFFAVCVQNRRLPDAVNAGHAVAA
jgi:hypothetical protein